MIQSVENNRLCYILHENVQFSNILYFNDDIVDECNRILIKIKDSHNSKMYAELYHHNTIIYGIKFGESDNFHVSKKLNRTSYGWTLTT